MKKLGLISGMGDLPKIIAQEAQSQGYTVFGIGLEPIADASIASYVDEMQWVNVGKFGTLIDSLKKFGVREAIMAGKVSKSLLYKSKITPDMRAIKLLFSIKNRNDDAILLAIAEELRKEGIDLLEITQFSTNILTTEGVLTSKVPSKDEWADIAFGWKIAKSIGALDIGQTVIVKNRAVMAIEAIEGTDEAIRRGGMLAGQDAVVVKVSKPDQDMRFDVPAVGVETLETMADVKAKVLAIEPGKSLMLDKDRMLQEAKKSRITIVGYSG